MPNPPGHAAFADDCHETGERVLAAVAVLRRVVDKRSDACSRIEHMLVNIRRGLASSRDHAREEHGRTHRRNIDWLRAGSRHELHVAQVRRDLAVKLNAVLAEAAKIMGRDALIEFTSAVAEIQR